MHHTTSRKHSCSIIVTPKIRHAIYVSFKTLNEKIILNERVKELRSVLNIIKNSIGVMINVKSL